MTYLVVGLDQTTFAPWHQNIQAQDVTTARQIAVARADSRGIRLVVAAVIGANSTVLSEPAAEPSAGVAHLPEAAGRRRRRGDEPGEAATVRELTERVRHMRQRLRAGEDA